MPSFFTASCAASQTDRGQRFLQATRQYHGVLLEPCTPQPIIDLQSKSFHWIATTEQQNEPQKTEALWAHGLGMLHALNEKIFLARHSFDLAQQTAQTHKQTSTWHDRLLWAQGTVSQKQGRAKEAITLFNQALKTNTHHPALLWGAAKAYLKTWRFKEAVPLLKKALQQTPQDIRIAIDLARSYSAQKKYQDCLKVSQTALRIEPRDPHLLRLQAIALEKLHPKSKLAQKAKDIFIRYKRDELAPAIQGKCQEKSAFCKRERLGFHSHALRPVISP